MRIFVSFLFLLAAAICGDTIYGKVVAVTDGDTIRVLDASKTQHKIRFLGIDAPESRQAFGQKSKQYLSELIFGKNVRVEYKERDRYQRILGTVFLGDLNVNVEMVKAGFAWHYVYYSRNDKVMAAAEAEARSAKAGLWVDPNPIPPWDFRRNKKSKK